MMEPTPSKLTKKQIAQETKAAKNNVVTKVAASTIIILSGLIIYLDKIFIFYGVELENLHGWKNTETYIWALTQTISPIIIMIGVLLRPYFYTLFVPIVCYSLQFYFVLNSNLSVDHFMTWIYVLSTSVIAIIVIRYIKRSLEKIDEIRNTEMEVLREIINNQPQ